MYACQMELEATTANNNDLFIRAKDTNNKLITLHELCG